jgi:hypothetical protein
MKWLTRKYARGGRVPKTKPQGVMLQLSPGAVACLDCDDWSMTGGTEIERMQAYQAHRREHHRT